MEGTGKVMYILLFVPQLLIIIFFIAILFNLIGIKKHMSKTKDNKKMDLYNYYSKVERYNNVKKDALNIMNDIISFFFLKCILLFMLFIVSIAIFQLLVKGDENVINAMNEITGKFPQELMNWLAIIITMIAMLVAFKKEYYLVFSVADVLEYYKFRRKTLSIISMMVFVKICEVAISISNKSELKFAFQSLMIASYIYVLYLCIYLIYRALIVLYSQERVELQLLDKLYFKIHDDLLISPNCYKENVAGIIINCNYLCGKYLETLNKKSIPDFRDIELQSVHRNNVNYYFDNIVYMIVKKINIYLIVLSSLYLGLELFSCNIFDLNFWVKGWETCRAIIISWLIWGIFFIILAGIEELESLPIKQIINRMFYDDNIYTFKDSNGNEKETSIFGWGIGKEDKEYFIGIYNIIIYWKLLIDGENPQNKKTFIEQLERNIKFANNKKDYDGLCEILIPICCFIEYLNSKDENIFTNYKIDSLKWKKYTKSDIHQQFIKAIVLNISALGDIDHISQELNEFVNKSTI